ncbi:MAG TPA: hypothetical protein VK773_10600, partial [Acidimicrobiales bacterium]|nr:hypothetical protein [Acidimicrobiales bacterium]
GSGSHQAVSTARIRTAAVVLAVVAVGGLVLPACSTIDKIKNAIHDVRGNKAVIDGFNSKLSNAPQTFEAVYTTTGSAPATVTYAAQLPNDVAFSVTPSGGSGNTTPVHLVQNSSGEYACSQTSGQWNCDKVSGVTASQQNALIDLYTPGHWTHFLSGVALVAGAAGDQVSTSTMSLNGFSMDCIDLVTPGTTGKSTICTTSQGVLGYVQVVSDSTAFEITSYSASPSPSLFQLPPGAKVTTVTVPTTVTTSG